MFYVKRHTNKILQSLLGRLRERSLFMTGGGGSWTRGGGAKISQSIVVGGGANFF